MPTKKCQRSACLRSIDNSDPHTHVVSLEEYCHACARRINAMCLDLYPKGVIVRRSELPK